MMITNGKHEDCKQNAVLTVSTTFEPNLNQMANYMLSKGSIPAANALQARPFIQP